MAFQTDFRFRDYFDDEWNRLPEPERIYGPVYYIGPLSVTAYLVETDDGLVVVDTGDAKDGYPFLSREVHYRLCFVATDQGNPLRLFLRLFLVLSPSIFALPQFCDPTRVLLARMSHKLPELVL